MAALTEWTQSARTRRFEHELLAPFHEGIVPEGALDPERAARAAAEAIVKLVAREAMSVTFEPGASFADTKGRRVNLDLGVLRKLQPFEIGLEHLFALAAHEGGHGRYTRAPSKKKGRLHHWVHNVVEDERVECLVARECRPFAHPLARARADLLKVDADAGSMLSALFALVRTPERMPSAMWDAHEDFLLQVIDILTPFPWSRRELERAVRRIIALLPKEVREGELPELRVFDCDCDGDAADADAADLRARLRARGRAWRDSAGVLERYPPVRWRDAARDAAGYDLVRREVGRDAARFAEGVRSLLPFRALPRARRGQLDRRRLHAWRYDDRLFCAPAERDTRILVSLLIDLSGSMRGESARIAQRIAVAIAEGAALLPGLRLYVYGHTADSGTGPNTEIVRFATPARGRVDTLGRLPIGHNNRDAHALELVGRDLRQREGVRRVPRLGIVICDGLPEARGFHGRAALEATKRSLSWFEQAWGPTVLVLTRETPTLRALMPGPYLPYDEHDPMPALVKAMAWKMRRAS